MELEDGKILINFSFLLNTVVKCFNARNVIEIGQGYCTLKIGSRGTQLKQRIAEKKRKIAGFESALTQQILVFLIFLHFSISLM